MDKDKGFEVEVEIDDEEEEEFTVGKTYELIIAPRYSLEDENLDDLESQEDKDPGNLTREFYEFAKQNNWLEEDDIVIPIGTKIVKIENLGFDIIDNYERFVIEGTNVQIALNCDWNTWDELLKEVV